MKNVAERLIAVAGQSPEMEAWISRQLMAGQKPSQILSELDGADAMLDRACHFISRDLRIDIALTTSLVFAWVFVTVGCLPS
ncbi:MAG: hypothetical protein EOS55_14090 [Mesorhizobium sp.]|nr:MAG: hypothetical protein EOS55_14090 [Mesorhizobium sp.]